MNIAFFSAKPYDKQFFDRINASFGFSIEYFETHLGPHSVNMVSHADAVCDCVNDRLNAEVTASLAWN